MKSKIILLSMVFTFLFSGCSERAQEAPDEIEDLTQLGIVNTQTSPIGIDSRSKDFESQLVDNAFYVVDDGIYYRLVFHKDNYEGYSRDVVNRVNQKYFTTENEIYIPTLFDDCELVYYSTTNLLDYMVWSRFYDLGYTIGVASLSEMTNGRIYLDMSDEDKMTIIPDSELMEIAEMGMDYVLLDKIGGKQIDSAFISDGLINVVEKSKTYDLEVYTGTYYKHYAATANIHAFREYELFASIEYETLRDRFYKIEIPEYFPTGYYTINGQDMFRLVRGTSYSEETDYNEQILFPALEEERDGTLIAREEDEYVAPRIYSDFPVLNQFETNIPGALGYVDKEALALEKDEEEKAPIILKEATIKEFELYFPKGKNCSITITSSEGETTGDIYVLIGNAMKTVSYDRLQEVYTANITGTGKKGTLVVSGLTQKYNIQLINCEQYDPAKHSIDENIEVEKPEDSNERRG